MDRDAIVSACSGPYPAGDPRARVLLEMLEEHDADTGGVARFLAEELRRRGGGPPTVTFAQAAVSWVCGMRPGSGEAIALVSRAAGWIAHALEEQRRPTPYRPRLAYTGPAPRATPRRPLDAVVDYLSRE
jgi:citrate synthase